jgi:hypothetical protein
MDGRAQERVESEQSLGYRVLVVRQFSDVHPAQAHYEVDAVVLHESLLLDVLPTVKCARGLVKDFGAPRKNLVEERRALGGRGHRRQIENIYEYGLIGQIVKTSLIHDQIIFARGFQIRLKLPDLRDLNLVGFNIFLAVFKVIGEFSQSLKIFGTRGVQGGRQLVQAVFQVNDVDFPDVV